MSQQIASLSSQRGASVTSVILISVVVVVAVKLLLAIVPAQISDYQMTKMLGEQLKEANSNQETAEQFVARVDRQLAINASYNTKAEETFTFTNEKLGQLAIRKDYNETNNFFANVDIVNRFEGDINSKSVD